MEKKSAVRLIALLMIFCLFFQLMPGSITQIDRVQSHTHNSKLFLSDGSIHTDALFIGRENSKSSFQKFTSKSNIINVNQISVNDTSLLKFSILIVPFDYRKVIRQSIPHYFNGSKYKNINLVI